MADPRELSDRGLVLELENAAYDCGTWRDGSQVSYQTLNDRLASLREALLARLYELRQQRDD